MNNTITSISNALIVGGGIGGMSTAICLAKRGVDVTLIDIDPEWRVYGAGITITGITLRAYQHLDMVDEIATKGAITNGSTLFRFDGMLLQELDEPPIEDGLPATGGIMRPILHKSMQSKVNELGVSVKLGLSVDALKNTETGVDVIFTDGSTGSFDLVVGADSVNSTVREMCFDYMSKPEQTGQACWRISMARPPELARGNIFLGHKYPVGITPCGENDVYMWMLTPHQKRERHFDNEELFVKMRENLAGFGGNAGWMRDNMTQDDWINYRPLEAKIQPRPWSDGRIVLLGDAVHATTPHLASGAGMAVESGIVLAQELEAASDPLEALEAYEERRYDRCKDIVDASIAIGRLQLEGGDPQQLGAMMGGAMHRLTVPF